jgi:hypothetical protein
MLTMITGEAGEESPAWGFCLIRGSSIPAGTTALVGTARRGPICVYDGPQSLRFVDRQHAILFRQAQLFQELDPCGDRC